MGLLNEHWHAGLATATKATDATEGHAASPFGRIGRFGRKGLQRQSDGGVAGPIN
jgi:hypothetical protein